MSQRAVSDLERGINRTARKDTALLLADALSLSGHTQELFIAAARGRAPAVELLAAARVGSVVNDELRSFRAVALIDSLPGRTVLAALWVYLVACQCGQGRAWAAI